MKKEYIVPSIKVKEMQLLPIMAASGPGAGDAILPGITEDGDDGPGGGDHGGTPGFGTGSRDGGTHTLSGTHTLWEE